MILLRLITESFRFAWNSLRSNLLRTILSLLGVSIGIFAIITVLTLVDSLEKNMKDSFSFLGAGVIYVEKWPFVGGPDFAWWTYMKRPNATYDEFRFLEDKSKMKSAICIYARKGGSTIKKDNNSVGGTNLLGVSEGYNDIFDLELGQGRYFRTEEIEASSNIALIGVNISEALFPKGNPVSQTIKVRGAKYRVIGILKEEGESFLGLTSNDDNVIIPYNSFRKIYATGGRFGIGSRIGIKGLEGDEGLKGLESEVRGLMRRKRGLKPKAEDTFEINRPEAIANLLEGVFDVLSIVGWIVGGFSILVGGFGIANIMFVSVKERTNIIGIQKSLGAKNYFILFQFIFEAIFLSIIGGITGLLLVSLITFVPLGSLEVVLTLNNILIGVGLSVTIGVLSGLIPAAIAARMDPVVAIRTQ